MNHRFLKTATAILLLLFCSFSYSQKTRSCTDIHEGVYYNYPKNSADKFVDVHEGDMVRETNIVTGDTSLWKVKWTDDCTYTLSLIDMNGKMEQQTREIMKKHKLVFAVNKVTDEWYTYTGYLDKTSNAPIVTDTMWMHEKTNITSNQLFKPVPGDQVYKRKLISDTSKYALLYVYRPGKIALSMATFLVYFDNNLLCVAQNSSGFVFKIMKEGNFELKTRLNKDESALPLTIQFGKRYFVKTSIDWGLHKHLSNYKLENELIDTTEGWTEFQDIKHF